MPVIYLDHNPLGNAAEEVLSELLPSDTLEQAVDTLEKHSFSWNELEGDGPLRLAVWPIPGRRGFTLTGAPLSELLRHAAKQIAVFLEKNSTKRTGAPW